MPGPPGRWFNFSDSGRVVLRSAGDNDERGGNKRISRRESQTQTAKDAKDYAKERKEFGLRATLRIHFAHFAVGSSFRTSESYVCDPLGD
jgi:hypothetical protein